jgi:hypothetical protein
MNNQNSGKASGLLAPPSIDEAEQLHYLREAAKQHKQLRIPLFKFVKGDFLLGKDKEKVPLGTELIAVLLEAHHGVEHWEGRECTERRLGKVASAFRVPNVKELNADEPSGGEWRHAIYFPVITPDGQRAMMFTSTSKGGRDAFYHLIESFAAGAQRHPGKAPKIRLGCGGYDSEKYGHVKEPTFDLVDWVDPPDMGALVVDDTEKGDAEKGDDAVEWQEKQKKRGDMDDEIPF